MTQTTIYLSVIRDDQSLVFEGSLDLFNELFATITNVSKGTATEQTITDLPAAATITLPQDAGQDHKSAGLVARVERSKSNE